MYKVGNGICAGIIFFCPPLQSGGDSFGSQLGSGLLLWGFNSQLSIVQSVSKLGEIFLIFFLFSEKKTPFFFFASHKICFVIFQKFLKNHLKKKKRQKRAGLAKNGVTLGGGVL